MLPNQAPVKASSDATSFQMDSATLNSLMRDAQWHEGAQGIWTKPTNGGSVQLRTVDTSGVYGEFEVRGSPALRTTPGKHLAANAGLAGPAKFVVPRGRRRPVCRIVLPPVAAEFVAAPNRELDDPRQFADWIRTWNGLLTGETMVNAADLDFEANTKVLKSNGWNAEPVPDKTLVHVQRPGLYSQIVLAAHPHGGWCIGADLIDLSGASPGSRRAVMRIASTANRRLPMARFSAAGTGGVQLRCEVHLGHGLVSNDWLLAATEAVEAGVVLTVRELQAAVRETELADLVVAAPAA